MASIRKKGRSFEVRIKVSGVSKSKTFATLQQCRTWARFAETELSDALKLTNHPDALLHTVDYKNSIKLVRYLQGTVFQARQEFPGCALRALEPESEPSREYLKA